MGRRPFRSLSVAEIQNTYLRDNAPVPSKYVLRLMREDERSGVRRIYDRLISRSRQQAAEAARLDGIRRLECELTAKGYDAIAGVDEAGVGPLAGPVVAAAVIFEGRSHIEGLDDSKKLDVKTRERLARIIQEEARCFAFGVSEVEEINRINVYRASLQAMVRAVRSLSVCPDYLLVDARRLKELPIPQQAIVHGDRRHFSIAAASILAKTHRDGLMKQLDGFYPGYGFARHKGYSTAEHKDSIRRLGPTPVHRTSYAVLDELTGAYSAAFYRLSEQLRAVGSSQDLEKCRHDLRRARGDLSADEIGKLKMLVRRLLKRYPSAVQPELMPR